MMLLSLSIFAFNFAPIGFGSVWHTFPIEILRSVDDLAQCGLDTAPDLHHHKLVQAAIAIMVTERAQNAGVVKKVVPTLKLR